MNITHLNRLSYRTNDFFKTLDNPCTSSGVISRMDVICLLVGRTMHQLDPSAIRRGHGSPSVLPLTSMQPVTTK